MQDFKRIQYDILVEIDHTCKEFGLTYYLAYGTLLGAIRHNGYIPWDDDIDVMMPRKDFIKFQMIYKSNRYSIHTCYNDKAYGFPFARIYDDRTYSMVGDYKTGGLSVDIYLLYSAPETEMDRNILIAKINIVSNLGRILRTWRSRLARYHLWPARNLNFSFLSWICKKEERLYSQYEFGETDAVFISTDVRLYEYKSFKDRVLIRFEDGLFMAPSGFDAILTTRYGNYMQLPPENERVYRHENDNKMMHD